MESKFIVYYLLPALGYGPGSWYQEVTVGRLRLDFLASANGTKQKLSRLQIAIEVKHPKENLDRHVRKFARYMVAVHAQRGMLINGRELRVYERCHQTIELRLKLSGAGLPEHLDELRQLVGIDALQGIQPVSHRPIVSSKASSMKVIAVYHNKGGVGKTTTVINLAAALRKRGKRILVIDLDSQANTTFALGLVKFQDEAHDDIRDRYIYHTIIERNKFPISEVIRKSDFCEPSIDVLPSHIDLMEKEQELIQSAAAPTRLVSKLRDVQDQYDIVLIDTPPSLNLYARIALIAADYLLIPSDLKPFANEGLKNVKRFVAEIDEFRESLGRSPLEILGVLASKVPTHARFIQYTLPKMEAIVEERYGFRLLQTRIFERREVSAAIEHSLEVGDLDIPDPRSVMDFKPDSQSAQEFEDLAKEVLGLIREL